MKYILFLGFVLLFSCGTDCKGISEIYRRDKCILIVERLNDSASVAFFDVDGISLTSKKDTVYNEQNRWFCEYYKYIERGDTIIKRKGELTFNIHKKDTVLTFKWACNGKVYE